MPDPQKLRDQKRRDSTGSAVPKHSIDKEWMRWTGGEAIVKNNKAREFSHRMVGL
jgi:hypothetical protein